MSGGTFGRGSVGVGELVGADSVEGVNVGLPARAVGVMCPTGAVLASPTVGVGVGRVFGVGVAEGLEVKARVARAEGVDGENVERGGDVGLAPGLQAVTRTHKPIKTR
ncbi:MAG: hypothetical protein P8186_10585 [Anaerolineae bacterium]